MAFGFELVRLSSKNFLNILKGHVFYRLIVSAFILIHLTQAEDDITFASSGSSSDVNDLVFHQIEGKVTPPDPKPADWYWATRILVDGGKKLAFLKEDNTFVINGLQSGSYLVEISNPDYVYEGTRVDINTKGKIRARKVNNVQPTQVNQVPYPLRLKTLGKYRYFQKREEWKVTDMLMNPMILMMVLPLLLITVLPKMMNDPETKREMEQMHQSMNVQNQVPEISEIMANLFGGGGSANSADKAKKRQKPHGITRRS